MYGKSWGEFIFWPRPKRFSLLGLLFELAVYSWFLNFPRTVYICNHCCLRRNKIFFPWWKEKTCAYSCCFCLIFVWYKTTGYLSPSKKKRTTVKPQINEGAPLENIWHRTFFIFFPKGRAMFRFLILLKNCLLQKFCVELCVMVEDWVWYLTSFPLLYCCKLEKVSASEKRSQKSGFQQAIDFVAVTSLFLFEGNWSKF